MFGGSSWPLFKLFGIQVVTNWTIILLFLIGRTPAGAIAIILTVLLHELGHALAAKSKGAYVEQVVIGFVGLASFSGALTSLQRAWIAFAGPLVNIVSALFFFFVLTQFGVDNQFRKPGTPLPFLDEFSMYMIQWGVLLGIFNLLPALPMDGGWVLQHLLETKVNQNQARMSALKVTVVVSVAFMVIAIIQPPWVPFDTLLLLIFGGIFFFLAFSEIKARQVLSSNAPGLFEQFFNQQKEKREERKEQKKQENEMQIRAKIDQLLVKISNEGMSSLTQEERDYLTEHSKQYPKS